MASLDAAQSKLLVRLVCEVGALPAEIDRCVIVFSWLEKDAAATFRNTGAIPTTSITRLVGRSTIHHVDPRRDIVIDACRPGDRDLVAVAILDIDRQFWPTVMGDGSRGLVGVADEPVKDRFLTINLHRPHMNAARPQPSNSARMTDSHLLEDPQSGLSCRIAVRRIWDQDNPACERCYTIYLLPGLSGNETVRIEDPVFYSGLEKLARQYQASFVVVSVDTSAEFGTHYLTDCREGSGRLDLLTRQLVDFIDSRYPTIAEPKFRVIAGQSSGAFNALQIAMRRPGIFGTVLASAPDALDIDSWLLDESGTVKPVWRAWMRLEQAVGGAGQMLSYARCWSPVSSLDTEWPCDPGTGVTSPRVLAAWRAAGTSSLLDSEDAREALRALHGRLVIGVGRDDEFDLCLPTERFSRRLDALGIEHQLIVDDAGHFDGSSRILRLLELSKALNSDPRDIS